MSFLTLWLALTSLAGAHPFGAEYHSLRTSTKATDRGLMVVVGLEVPNQVVLAEFKQRYAHLDKIRERHQVEFRELMWERLAKGVSLSINGETVVVDFEPLDKEINGRGGEQFFIYMVGATFPAPHQRWGDRLDVEVEVDSFQVPDMYLSAYATQEAPWTVASTSASGLIGAHATSPDATAESAWTRDASLRKVEVVYQRKP